MPNMTQMSEASDSKSISVTGPASKSAGTGGKFPSKVRTHMTGKYEGGVAGQTKLESLSRKNRG